MKKKKKKIIKTGADKSSLWRDKYICKSVDVIYCILNMRLKRLHKKILPYQNQGDYGILT